MTRPRTSERRGRDLAESLVKAAKELARAGGDVSPGTPEYYDLMGQAIREIGMLLQTIQVEVWEEQQAGAEETRQCITCQGTIIKKHKRGRWPIYCENCSAAR